MKHICVPDRSVPGLRCCREQLAAVSDFAARARAVKQWPGLFAGPGARHPVWGTASGSNQQRRTLLDNLLQVS